MKVFKSQALIPNKVKPLLSETVTNINDCLEGEYDNEMLVSHLAFCIVEGELTSTFIKAVDPHKRNADMESITYKFCNMTSLEDGVLIRAIEKKKGILKDLKAMLISKFTDFSSHVFGNMNWVDPKNWDDEKTYGIDQITALILHFEVPLKAAGFDSKAVFKEWRFFKNYVRASHIGLESLQLWKKIFNNKKVEHSNLCKLTRIVPCRTSI